MPLNKLYYQNMYKWCHETRRNYPFINLKATKISKRCVFLFWSRGPDGYRKNDRKREVVWPWLVLELCTVLALTQSGIRQSDWWRAGIRSTNLHIVVEYLSTYCPWSFAFSRIFSTKKRISWTNRSRTCGGSGSLLHAKCWVSSR